MSTTYTPMSRTAELLPYIRTRAPMVPLPYAEFQARLAVIEFCERTRCWRQITKKTIGSTGRVNIAIPGATIHEFEEATLDGCLLDPVQYTETDGLREELTTGTARYISQITPGEVLVHPVQEGELRISCFMKPRHGQSIGTDATNPLADGFNILPSFMISQYATALADGALFRIMSTPKQDFTDLKLAGTHKQSFDDACDRNFGANMRGQQRAPKRVKARFI